MSEATHGVSPAAGESVPEESVDAMTRRLCEEVRRTRQQRSWSLAELSTASGVSRSMLSQIERAEVNPTLAVVYRIASAFGVPLSSLVGSPSGPVIQTVRGSERATLFRSDRYCRVRTLSPLTMEKQVEFYEVVLKVGGALKSSAHYRGTREILTVNAGRVQVTAGETDTQLAATDSASYPADVPHAIVNISNTEAVVFLVVHYTV